MTRATPCARRWRTRQRARARTRAARRRRWWPGACRSTWPRPTCSPCRSRCSRCRRAPPGAARAGPAGLRVPPPQAGHGRGVWCWMPMLHGAKRETLIYFGRKGGRGLKQTHAAQGQPEDVHAERQAAGAGEEPPERGADGTKLSKKARAALARAAERERGARRAGAAERMEPEVRPARAGQPHTQNSFRPSAQYAQKVRLCSGGMRRDCRVCAGARSCWRPYCFPARRCRCRAWRRRRWRRAWRTWPRARRRRPTRCRARPSSRSSTRGRR